MTARNAIVVMTVKIQEQDRIDTFEAGADDLIRKPYNWEESKSKVARFLQ